MSEGCVSLSGGAEHRLKAAGPCYMLCSWLLGAAKVVNTNVAASNLVAVCSAKCARRRPGGGFVTYANPASSQKPSGSIRALKAFALAAYKFQPRENENDPKMPPTDDKPPKVLPLTCDFPTLRFPPPLHAASFYSKKLWNDTQLDAGLSSSHS